MSTEENKALSNRVAEAINRADLDAFDEVMAPELAQESKREIADLRRAITGMYICQGYGIALVRSPKSSF